MKKLRFLRRLPSPLCCFFLIGFMALLTVSAVAQDTLKVQEIENDWQVEIGFYISGSGLKSSFNEALRGVYGGGAIESPEDDFMPYPHGFISIRYNRYQATFGWADDLDRNPAYRHRHNEHIARFTARYNYYPVQEVLYVFGGPVLWYFNKERTFTRYRCTDFLKPGDPGYTHYTECKPGAEELVHLNTDRPDGKSIRLGIITGLGIEYTILGLVLSHEVEFYFSPSCGYKEFICSGFDLKILGVHLRII